MDIVYGGVAQGGDEVGGGLDAENVALLEVEIHISDSGQDLKVLEVFLKL